MKLRHAVGYTCKPKGRKGMTELVVGHARKFAYLVNRQAAEITHLVTKKNIMFFVPRFFRCMRCKYQPPFYFINIFFVFLIQIEISRNTMRFI